VHSAAIAARQLLALRPIVSNGLPNSPYHIPLPPPPAHASAGPRQGKDVSLIRLPPLCLGWIYTVAP